MGDGHVGQQAVGHDWCPYNRTDKHVLIDCDPPRQRCVGDQHVLLDSLAIEAFNKLYKMLAESIHRPVEIDVPYIHAVIPSYGTCLTAFAGEIGRRLRPHERAPARDRGVGAFAYLAAGLTLNNNTNKSAVTNPLATTPALTP